MIQYKDNVANGSKVSSNGVEQTTKGVPDKMIKEQQRIIDDYLDLFLLAKGDQDAEWQEEIKEKLAAIRAGKDLFADKKKDLQRQFIEINRQILVLYQKLHRESSGSQTLAVKLLALKQRRLELSREIDQLKDEIDSQTCR